MDNLELIRSFYDALNHHAPKKAASLFSSTGEFKSMDTLEVTRGPQIEKMMEGWISAFPDLKMRISEIYGVGDHVVCEYTVTGTHKGTLEGPTGVLKPTQKPINVASCDTFKVRNGQIQSVNCYFESFTLFHQLGISELREAA